MMQTMRPFWSQTHKGLHFDNYDSVLLFLFFFFTLRFHQYAGQVCDSIMTAQHYCDAAS